jgi:hypothetical protein
MQGTEYHTKEESETAAVVWCNARDQSIKYASALNTGEYPVGEISHFFNISVTKQLCNRLLEPFMWHTVIITGTEWTNFFELRCPRYEILRHPFIPENEPEVFKSRKEAIEAIPSLAAFDEDDWRHHNKGQAEIHMMELAEQIYDAVRLSQPKQLKAGEWHIPFEDKCLDIFNQAFPGKTLPSQMKASILIRLSTALCARVSYTTVGEDKDVDYNTLIKIHDKMEKADPFHASPFEHCCVAMNDEEYYSYVQGRYPTISDRWGIVNQEHYPYLYSDQLEQNIVQGVNPNNPDIYGWCRNFRGFIQYRVKLEDYAHSNKSK